MGNLISSGPKTEVIPTVTNSQGEKTVDYIREDTATAILNKQQQLIAKLQQAKRDTKLEIPPETIEQFQNKMHYQTHKENFDSAGYKLQSPFSLPLSRELEVNDISNAYNQAVNIINASQNQSLDEARFNAYIYLQEKKLNQLKDAIDTYPTNANIRNNPIKAVKNLATSNLLNVESFPDPASFPTSANPLEKYNGNGSSVYPNYLIYGNNGCLNYNSSDATYNFQACNSNNPEQRFIMNQILNKDDYNGKITDPTNASYKINNTDNTIMGFYVVNPENSTDKCININKDGLSVMPCNMQNSQRFKPYYHSISP